MPVESGDRRPARAQNSMEPHPPPKTTEPLPCPRCESTNTKFCYYNNYNLCQPRHFCKSCRRYWTQGGTLRNVPVGGGTRKNSKRSRSSSSSTSSSSSSATSNSNLSSLTHEPESLPAPVPANNHDSRLPVLKAEISDDLNLNETLPTLTESENFMSLLNSQEHGFMGLSGYGSGFGLGAYEMGLGFAGRGVWPYPGTGNTSSGGNGGVVAGGTTSGCNTWQLGDIDGGAGVGGLVDGEYFAWPGLAISAPGKGLK